MPWPVSYTFTDEDVKWFSRQPGVEEVKVETEPGDLILWDSRTVHWNRAPTAEQIRVVVYVCYAPRSMASEGVLAARRRCWDEKLATTHWCVSFPVLFPLCWTSPLKFLLAGRHLFL